MMKLFLEEFRAFRTEVREELRHLHGRADEDGKRLKYITDEIQVNGEVGLKAILTENHRQNTELHNKVGPMWDYTEKLRTRFKLVRTLKEFLKSRPILSGIIEGFIGKFVKRAAITVLALLAAATFGDASVHVIIKLFTAIAGAAK